MAETTILIAIDMILLGLLAVLVIAKLHTVAEIKRIDARHEEMLETIRAITGRIVDGQQELNPAVDTLVLLALEIPAIRKERASLIELQREQHNLVVEIHGLMSRGGRE